MCNDERTMTFLTKQKIIFYSKFFIAGCIDRVGKIAGDHLIIVGAVALGICLVQLLGTLLACVLHCKLKELTHYGWNWRKKLSPYLITSQYCLFKVTCLNLSLLGRLAIQIFISFNEPKHTKLLAESNSYSEKGLIQFNSSIWVASFKNNHGNLS